MIKGKDQEFDYWPGSRTRALHRNCTACAEPHTHGWHRFLPSDYAVHTGIYSGFYCDSCKRELEILWGLAA